MPDADPKVPLKAYKAVGRDDYTDVVKLGENFVLGNVLAIRSDGQPVLWDREGKRNTPSRAQAVAVYQDAWLNSFFWIDRSGKVKCDRKVRSEFKRELEGLKNVVHCEMGWGIIFAITDDGERHLIGTAKDHPNIALAFKDPETIISAKFAGPLYASALRNDGSITSYVKEKLVKKINPGKCVYQYNYPLIAGPEGTLIRNDGSFNAIFSLIQEFEPPIRSSESGKAIRAFQLEDRSWRILKYEASESKSWKRNADLEKAFEGAIQIKVSGKGFIIALLPANSVPRSGLWDLDELIAARKK